MNSVDEEEGGAKARIAYCSADRPTVGYSMVDCPLVERLTVKTRPGDNLLL